MIEDGCGSGEALVCSTSTAAGLYGSQSPGGNLPPSPLGMNTERFGSANSTKVFSIGRQRVLVQRIPWSRISDTSKGRQLCCLIGCKAAYGFGFLDGGMAYFKDSQNSSSNVAEWLRDASVSDLQLGSDGAVWAATERGLGRVETGHVMTLTSKNGLPCDAVNWVMQDDNTLPAGCTCPAAWCGLRVQKWIARSGSGTEHRDHGFR